MVECLREVQDVGRSSRSPTTMMDKITRLAYQLMIWYYHGGSISTDLYRGRSADGDGEPSGPQSR